MVTKMEQGKKIVTVTQKLKTLTLSPCSITLRSVTLSLCHTPHPITLPLHFKSTPQSFLPLHISALSCFLLVTLHPITLCSITPKISTPKSGPPVLGQRCNT